MKYVILGSALMTTGERYLRGRVEPARRKGRVARLGTEDRALILCGPRC